MKKRLLIILIACTMLFSGCAYANLGVDGLLYAPKLSEEQAIIHQALIDTVGKDIELKYPRTGDNRSAFVVANIDDEPTDEAIVFYQKINSTEKESNIRINVLDQLDGKWKSVYDLHGIGTEIEKIIISELGSDKGKNIIIGFNMINKNEKTLQIYNYADKKLNNTYSDTYSIMNIMDIDQDLNSELVTVTNSIASKNVVVKIFKSVDGQISNTSALKIEDRTITNLSSEIGYINDKTPAIFMDAVNENGLLQTEVLYFKNDSIKDPMASTSSLLKATNRPVGYNSRDVDLDGIVEIPVTNTFWGYEDSPDEEKMYMTDWYVFNSLYTINKKYSSYFNLNDAYAFMLPSRWQGAVTVKRDTATDEIVFYKYDGKMSDDMIELMRIRVVTKKDMQENINEGYNFVKAKGQIEYFVKLSNDKSEKLVLTMSEVINNFYII